MVKRHLKSLTVPVTWPINRKDQKFVVRPHPSKEFYSSMPLSLIFKNQLRYCKTSKEVKAILLDKEILVDGIRKKDPKSSVGLFDVLSIPLAKESFRMVINNKQKLQLVPITHDEASIKICKIIGKTILQGGKLQLNLSDGRNIIVKDDKYSLGDCLLITLPNQEIKDVFKLEKGNYVYLISGKHVGEHGHISAMEKQSNGLITVQTKQGKFDTPKSSAIIVGKEKPVLKLE